jgi:DNA-binding transcriptional LysR family regulator
MGAQRVCGTCRQSLTEEGQRYYERCVRALDELRAGQAALETGRQEAAGLTFRTSQTQFVLNFAIE